MKGSQLFAVIVLKSGDRDREVTAANWLEHPESSLCLVDDEEMDFCFLGLCSRAGSPLQPFDVTKTQFPI